MNSEINDFLRIIRNCRYTNTYKMVWARSLVKISEEKNTDNSEETIIYLTEIANLFFKFYWNISSNNYIEQGPSGNKKPIIYSIVYNTMNRYKELNGTFDFYSKAIKKFKDYNINYSVIINEIKDILKHDVSYRFLILDNTKINIYNYIKGKDFLVISNDLLKDMKLHIDSIISFIDKRWLLSLKKFNINIDDTNIEELLKNVDK